MYVREQSGQKEKALTFTVSGKLWNRSLVMLDEETESLWSHLLGEAMDGELKGTVLETLPSTMVDWKTWKTDHPDTTVIALKRTSREFVKAFHENAGRFVLGLRTLEKARSYGFDVLQKTPVVNDEFDGTPVVIVYRPESAGGRAFLRTVDGETLRFESSDAGKTIIDTESGSTWNPETGLCENGKRKGQKLEEIPAIVSFGKSWYMFYPESERYRR